jgi:hypothetical protein
VSSSSNESERKQTAEVGDEAMPLAVDAKVIFLGGIFLILFLVALYAVADSRSTAYFFTSFQEAGAWTIRNALSLPASQFHLEAQRTMELSDWLVVEIVADSQRNPLAC